MDEAGVAEYFDAEGNDFEADKGLAMLEEDMKRVATMARAAGLHAPQLEDGVEKVAMHTACELPSSRPTLLHSSRLPSGSLCASHGALEEQRAKMTSKRRKWLKRRTARSIRPARPLLTSLTVASAQRSHDLRSSEVSAPRRCYHAHRAASERACPAAAWSTPL